MACNAHQPHHTGCLALIACPVYACLHVFGGRQVEAELAMERERAAKEAEAARAAIAVKEAELQALEVERKARVSVMCPHACLLKILEAGQK